MKRASARTVWRFFPRGRKPSDWSYRLSYNPISRQFVAVFIDRQPRRNPKTLMRVQDDEVVVLLRQRLTPRDLARCVASSLAVEGS